MILSDMMTRRCLLYTLQGVDIPDWVHPSFAPLQMSPQLHTPQPVDPNPPTFLSNTILQPTTLPLSSSTPRSKTANFDRTARFSLNREERSVYWDTGDKTAVSCAQLSPISPLVRLIFYIFDYRYRFKSNQHFIIYILYTYYLYYFILINLRRIKLPHHEKVRLPCNFRTSEELGLMITENKRGLFENELLIKLSLSEIKSCYC